MSPRVVQFGTFQVNLDSGELFREGIRLKLGAQPFQVLEQLLARPGEVVTRDDLRAALWASDTFVDFDHGLNTAINKIREALGDSASNPRFVETVPRRGYRFIAPIARAEQATTPQAQPEPSPPSKPLRWKLAAAVAAATAIAGSLLFRPRPEGPVHYELRQLTRDSGLTYQPSISADGNLVVYASDRATGEHMDVWIQHVSGGQPIRLTSAPGDEIFPSISSDGRRVAFLAPAAGGIFVTPALGGTVKLVASGGQDPQISPNGTTVAYATGTVLQQSAIRLVPADGGPSRKLPMNLAWAAAPVWTRDGNSLLLWAQTARKDHTLDYWLVPSQGGTPIRTGVREFLKKSGLRLMSEMPYSWYPAPVASFGANGLVIAVRSGDGHDLWLAPLSKGLHGPAVRITAGAQAANPSMAVNGRIAFARLNVSSGLWMLPLEANTGRVRGEMRRIWRENASVAYPNVSADGKKLAYMSNRAGNPDVWVRNLETGEDLQLTTTKADEYRGLISPNGDRVAFTAHAGSAVYTVPSNGGLETKVCETCGNVMAWSPDGAKLLYYSGLPVRFSTLELATGAKQEVIRHPAADIHNARLSPDGRWITFIVVADGSRVAYVAAMAGGSGGKPESWIRISDAAPVEQSFWSPGGNLLYLYQSGALWARRLDPLTKKPSGDAFFVQGFDGPRYHAQFSASGLTGDTLYFKMDETTANIWIAEPSAAP